MRKKVNIADIVRITGLSRATVDRVLNGRDGVRPETARRIEDAIERIGYSQSMLNARAGAARKRIEICLSEGANPFFAQLRAGFAQRFAALDPESEICAIRSFDPYEPATVVSCLETICEHTDAVITIGVDAPEVQHAIDTLVARGVRVVTVISDVPGSRRAVHVGQDNFIAGRTAARLMVRALPDKPCSVAVLIGHLRFRHLLDRQSGFQQVLGLARPDVNLVLARPYGTQAQNAADILGDLAPLGDKLQGFYIAGGGQPHLVAQIAAAAPVAPVVIGHETTALTRDQLKTGRYRYVLAHDVRHVARLAIDAAFDTQVAGNLDVPTHIYVEDNFPELLDAAT